MAPKNYLAFDLGAESGRAVLGTLDGGRISLREIHRFPNGPLTVLGRLHWNVYALLDGIKAGLAACAAEGAAVESLAVDTWGVDFGLLAADGSLLGLPFAYREPRNAGAMERFFGIVPRERLYDRTGIQFLPFNSIFQLQALRENNTALLGAADRFLMMPDLFTYFLSGAKINEATIASTSQLLDPRLKDWAPDLFEALGIRPSLFSPPLDPGQVVGMLLPGPAKETGMPQIPVVAAASHDTASAVAAVPALDEDWAYISSGTWSLIGVEAAAPIINAETRRLNFTNEGGVGGTIRFLKNVTGLWLVQQCRKKWNADRPLSYEEMAVLAESAPPFGAFIDPDAPDFANPEDMPAAIRAYCRRTGQTPPQTPAEITRCAIESLALKYRQVLDDLRRLSPRPIRTLHVIGGGSRHVQLCQYTADAAKIPVVAGPAEATALGNIMAQAVALGHGGSIASMRAAAAASFTLERYEPRDTAAWDRAYERFAEITGRNP
jgi:rhamnulokinase